jgi:alpha-L-fucosidase 2
MFKSIILFFCLSAIYQSTTAQTSPLLWYNKPATKWTEGLLIGNGRLAAMIYTDSVSEIIQVNEESVWGGKNYNDNNPLAKSSLPEIREMLFKDSNQAATDLANKTLLSVLNEGSTTPAAGFRSYQNLMNIHLHFSDTSEAKEYKRQLNLFSGVITTTYQKGANTLQEEYFASANANLIFVRVSSLKNLPVNFSITVKRPSENGDEPVKDASVKFIQPDILMLEGQIIDDSTDKRGPSGAHMKFAGAVKITAPGGALKNYNDSVVITNASSVVLIINGATNYDFESLDFSDNISPSNQCLDVINRIQPVNFEELKTTYCRFQQLYETGGFQLKRNQARYNTNRR